MRITFCFFKRLSFSCFITSTPPPWPNLAVIPPTLLSFLLSSSSLRTPCCFLCCLLLPTAQRCITTYIIIVCCLLWALFCNCCMIPAGSTNNMPRYFIDRILATDELRHFSSWSNRLTFMLLRMYPFLLWRAIFAFFMIIHYIQT